MKTQPITYDAIKRAFSGKGKMYNDDPSALFVCVAVNSHDELTNLLKEAFDIAGHHMGIALQAKIEIKLNELENVLNVS